MPSTCDFCGNEMSFDFRCHKACLMCLQKQVHKKLLVFFQAVCSNPENASGIFDGRCPHLCNGSSSMPVQLLKEVVESIRSYGPPDVFLYFDAFESYFEGKFTFFWECSNCQKINSMSESFSSNCWYCDLRYKVPEGLKRLKKTQDLNARRNHKLPSINKKSSEKQIGNNRLRNIEDKTDSNSKIPKTRNKKTKIDQSAAIVLENSDNYLECFERYIQNLTRSPNIRIKQLIALVDDDDSCFYDKFLQTHHYIVEMSNNRNKKTYFKIAQSLDTAIGVIEVPAQLSDLLGNGIEITKQHIRCSNPSNYLLKFIISIN